MGRKPYKKKDERKSKYNFIQFSVTDSEKKKIKDFISGSNFKTVSQFIHEAVFDFIRKSEHPELFNNSQGMIISQILEELTKNQQIMTEIKERTLERTEIIDDMEKNRILIQDIYERLKKKELINDFSNEAETISNLLKAHKSLSIEQISKMTGINKEDIEIIVNAYNIFKLNPITGGFELR